MKRKIFIVLISFVFLVNLFSKEYEAKIAQVASTDYFVNLLKAISGETNSVIKIEIVPFARMTYFLENKQSDIGCPMNEVKDEKKRNELKFDYSTVTILKSVFVLYVNKNKLVDVADLKKGNTKNYKIETAIAFENNFEFTCMSSPSAEASLKKVDSGVIDGFIFAQGPTDVTLKKLGLTNIKRIYYDIYNTKFILQKGAKNSDLDKLLTEGMEKVKKNGKYEQILGNYARVSEKYDDWQL